MRGKTTGEITGKVREKIGEEGGLGQEEGWRRETVTDFQKEVTELEEEKLLKRPEVEEQGVEKRRRSGEEKEIKKREGRREGGRGDQS